MKSIHLLPIMAATALAAERGLQEPATAPILGTDTVHGCYSSVGELALNTTNKFNTQGLCGETCRSAGFAVAATQASKCYCGTKYPAASTLADDSECNEPCPGFAPDACGGTKAFTVINTGLKVTVENSTDAGSSSAKASSSVTNAASSTASGTAVMATATGSGSNATTSTGNPTGASGSPSSSSAPIPTSAGTVPQLSVNGVSLAVLGMNAIFFL